MDLDLLIIPQAVASHNGNGEDMYLVIALILLVDKMRSLMRGCADIWSGIAALL